MSGHCQNICLLKQVLIFQNECYDYDWIKQQAITISREIIGEKPLHTHCAIDQ